MSTLEIVNTDLARLVQQFLQTPTTPLSDRLIHALNIQRLVEQRPLLAGYVVCCTDSRDAVEVYYDHGARMLCVDLDGNSNPVY